MSHSFKVIPAADIDIAGALVKGAAARLVCPSLPVGQWPVVCTRANIGDRRGEITISAAEIAAISFDRERWWIWPPKGSEGGSSDNPGALDTPDSPDVILGRYLLGQVSADLCEIEFGQFGLATDHLMAAEPGNVTDDPGCAAPPDETHDYGSDEVGDVAGE